MELFSLYADGEDIRALFVVHLSDFTTDHSLDHGQVDDAFLEGCVVTPEDVSYFFPRGEDMFGIKVRGFSSIGKFLAASRALRTLRAFNLAHMNRGRNAYQASHCYSLADHMLGDGNAEYQPGTSEPAAARWKDKPNGERTGGRTGPELHI